MCQWMPPTGPWVGWPPPRLRSMRTEKGVKGVFEVADEFLRPVAFLAGLLGRAQVLDRRGDGTGVFVRHGRIDLVGAGQLGTDIPVGAFADMAFSAGDPRVG